MIAVLSNFIFTIFSLISVIVVFLILAFVNIGINLIDRGKSYGDFTGQTCIELMSNNFDTELLQKDDNVSCTIRSLFPDFLSEYSYSYGVDKNYETDILKIGLSKTDYKEENEVCYEGSYKSSWHYIRLNNDLAKVSRHEINP